MENPSYKQVASGKTGHLEAVEVYYDPKQISYEGLLAAFWRMIDPTDEGGQFADRGHQYSTAIFYHNEEQKQVAGKSLRVGGRQGQRGRGSGGVVVRHRNRDVRGCEHDVARGRPVVISTAFESVTGTALGLDEGGALLIERPAGAA